MTTEGSTLMQLARNIFNNRKLLFFRSQIGKEGKLTWCGFRKNKKNNGTAHSAVN